MATEGFPELDFEPKCRICQLSQRQRGLLRVIHDYRRKEGLGNTAISNRIKDICVGQGIKPIDERNVGRHFKNHVDFDLISTLAAESFDIPATSKEETLLRDEYEMLRASAEDLASGRNESDYHNMVDLFRRLLRRIAALDSDPTAFINPDGNHSMQKLSIWKGMIDSAARIISDLNKMRNQDKMTVSILESHTKKFATEVAAPIGMVLRDVRNDLLSVDDPKAHHMAARIDAMLAGGVTTIFSQAAASSMRQSKEKYKLLN